MKKTKLVALLLVLALCVSLLAGCGSKANDTANSNGDAATNEPASNETGPTRPAPNPPAIPPAARTPSSSASLATP